MTPEQQFDDFDANMKAGVAFLAFWLGVMVVVLWLLK